MNQTLIYLNTIDLEASPRVRHITLDEETVERYAQNYAEKRDMPPLILFWDETKKIHLLGDGRHRIAALNKVGRKVAMALVHKGDFNECLKVALLANSVHGLPRSNADKRQCVIVAIKQWPELSNIHTAKMCDVDDKTVAKVRLELEEKKVIPPTPVRVGSDGLKFKVNKSKDEDEDEDEEKPRINTADLAKDPTGRIVPNKVLVYWNRSDEPKQLIEKLSELAGHLKSANAMNDLMYCELNFTGVMADISKIVENLKTVIPYCVCTTCQGHPETQPKGQCRMCYGRGVISKFRYDALVPKEVKDIITKGKKK